MRVTDKMVANQSLFNLQRSLSSFLRLQQQMTTGRIVSKPSDDPIGIQRDLEYRTEIARIEQFQMNISLGSNLLGRYENNLSDLNDLASQAFEIAVAVANETNDAENIRPAYLGEIESSIDRILQIIATELDSRRIYSGHRTDTSPLQIGSSGVTYVGDNGTLDVEVDRTTTIQMNITARDVLLKQFDPVGSVADLNVGVDSLSLLAELRNGAGIDIGGFTVTNNNLGLSVGIDLSVPTPAVTLSDAVTRINTQLTSGGITSLTAAIGPDNNIVLTAAPNGLISNNTAIGNLNGGTGVDLQPGLIRVQDGSGAFDFTIDLSGAANIGDVITAINAGLAANGVTNVTVALNAGSTGLDITDSNGVPLGLSFSDVTPDDFTAQQLGLRGPVDPVLNGTDLNPKSDFTITEGAGQTASDLGITGSFSVNMAGAELEAIMTSATPLSRLNNSNGLTLGTIQMTQGLTTRTVDLGDPALVTIGDVINAINSSGLNVTASINAGRTGIQVVNNSLNDSFLLENTGSTSTATTLGIYGSSDFIGTLYLFRNELQRPDQESINADDMKAIMGAIKSGMENLLILRGNTGSKQRRLDATSDQLAIGELEVIKLLSEVEDADIAELVTRLATHENNFRAALIAMSRIIQPSLMDFLR